MSNKSQNRSQSKDLMKISTVGEVKIDNKFEHNANQENITHMFAIEGQHYKKEPNNKKSLGDQKDENRSNLTTGFGNLTANENQDNSYVVIAR